jgi:hypothetical protein
MKQFLLATALIALPLSAQAEDWTGGYGGFQFGGSDIDVTGGLDGDGESYGVFVGYNWDRSGIVYGLEVDWDATDYAINGGAVNVDQTARLKGRLGVSTGNGLAFASAGVVRANTDAIGNDTGYLLGLGYDHAFSNGTVLGGELLQHEFDDFDGGGLDVSVTTFKARVAFQF